MTSSGSGESTGGVADEDLCATDGLLDRPFPERKYRDGAGCGGPGFHLLVLQTSRDFWDCPEETVVEQAEADLQERLDALETRLVARWGEPTEVDLWPYLEAGLAGAAVPEPIDSLCQLSGSMHIWLRPDCGRWLALTIGQGDKELPFEFLIAVGETDAVDPTRSLQDRPAASDVRGSAVQGLGSDRCHSQRGPCRKPSRRSARRSRSGSRSVRPPEPGNGTCRGLVQPLGIAESRFRALARPPVTAATASVPPPRSLQGRAFAQGRVVNLGLS